SSRGVQARRPSTKTFRRAWRAWGVLLVRSTCTSATALVSASRSRAPSRSAALVAPSWPHRNTRTTCRRASAAPAARRGRPLALLEHPRAQQPPDGPVDDDKRYCSRPQVLELVDTLGVSGGHPHRRLHVDESRQRPGDEPEQESGDDREEDDERAEHHDDVEHVAQPVGEAVERLLAGWHRRRIYHVTIGWCLTAARSTGTLMCMPRTA